MGVTIADATFVLLDCETAGVEKGDDLLEIAARELRSGLAFDTLVRPTKPIPPEASAVHHLIDDDFEDAPDRDVALEQLLAFVPDPHAVIVAYNAPFDRGVIAPALDDRAWICSERLAHHLVPQAPNFKLATLYYFLGGPKIETPLHRAIADLRILDFVFGRLMDLYTLWAAEKCAGDEARLAKSAEIESLLAFAERPYVMLTVPFGKYAGQPFDALIADAGYTRWMLGLPDLSADLRYNIERAKKRREGAAA